VKERFLHTTRRVALTPAGEALLERSRSLLDGVADAVQLARDAALGRAGRLRVGLLATAALDLTPVALRAFAADVPGAQVSVHDVRFDDPSGGVRHGDADIALIWTPVDERGLDVEPLFDEPRVAVLAADHPLAARKRLTVDDLLDQPWPGSQSTDRIAEAFWTLAHERGGPPPTTVAVSGFEDLLVAIRAGLAVDTTPAAIAHALPFGNLITRHVDGLRPTGVALCRPEKGANPLADAFAIAARAAAKGAG
jgi:DNA-binding transcriptional LysR family regulator